MVRRVETQKGRKNFGIKLSIENQTKYLGTTINLYSLKS